MKKGRSGAAVCRKGEEKLKKKRGPTKIAISPWHELKRKRGAKREKKRVYCKNGFPFKEKGREKRKDSPRKFLPSCETRQMREGGGKKRREKSERKGDPIQQLRCSRRGGGEEKKATGDSAEEEEERDIKTGGLLLLLLLPGRRGKRKGEKEACLVQTVCVISSLGKEGEKRKKNHCRKEKKEERCLFFG